MAKINVPNYLAQAQAAEKWIAEQLAKAQAAGHTVIGDTIIIEGAEDVIQDQSEAGAGEPPKREG